MRKFFGVLKYVKGYWNYAILNITFNILSVIFSLFSLAMLFPFLQVLLLGKDEIIKETVAKGVPAFKLNATTMTDIVNYYLAERIASHGKMDALIAICVFIVITISLKNLFRYLGMFFVNPIRNGVVRDIRNRMYNKILKLPLSYYSEERKGDIMSRMTVDVQEIEWSIMQSLEMIFREPITMLMFLATMIIISPALSVFSLVLLPLSGLLIARIGKSLRRSSAKGKEKMGVLLSMMEEALGGLRIIKGFNAEKKMNSHFQEENQQYTNIQVKVLRKNDLSSPLSETLGVIVMVIVLYFGGKLVLSNDPSLTGSLLIFYIAIFSQLLVPAK